MRGVDFAARLGWFWEGYLTLGAFMKRWTLAASFLLVSAVSAAAGYWFGFRKAFPLGIAADYLPRGSIAVVQLNALRAEKPANVITGLEFDVDNGLIWGSQVFHHPLRDYLGPVWGLNIYPDYEKYATRLADYRRVHPSPMRADMFDTVPPGKEQYREFYRDLAQGTRENTATVNSMVERYASKQ
jgi:hypothetical protein